MRLFVGIFPSQSTQAKLNQEAGNWCKRFPTKVRLLPPETLHLTIKFIGNVELTQSSKFTTAFLKAKNNLPSASLQITQLMLFPSNRKPQVLAAVVERSPELDRIFQFFNENFCDLGITAEQRSFRPHISLVRLSRSWRKETTVPIPFQLTEPIASIALIHSQLSPKGAKYSTIASIPLGK